MLCICKNILVNRHHWAFVKSKITHYMVCMFHQFYCITGALSITDDYCVSYTVTMVDVRSCTRPPRSHDQQHISEYPRVFIPPTAPRSHDPTHISKCTDISRLPRSLHSQSSTNTGVFNYHYCVPSTKSVYENDTMLHQYDWLCHLATSI